jgi:hypothetical protein
MDGYSWSNRKQQGALFCQFCPQVGKPRGHQPLFGSDSAVRRSVLSSTVLVIGKAYDEPICNIHIENILLQRDFIID